MREPIDEVYQPSHVWSASEDSYVIGYDDGKKDQDFRFIAMKEDPDAFTESGWDIEAYFLGYADGLGDLRSASEDEEIHFIKQMRRKGVNYI